MINISCKSNSKIVVSVTYSYIPMHINCLIIDIITEISHVGPCHKGIFVSVVIHANKPPINNDVCPGFIS